jgi:hypothetical protein
LHLLTLQKQQNVLVRVLVSAINQKHNPFMEQLIEKLPSNFNVHGMALLAELMMTPVDVQKIRIFRTTGENVILRMVHAVMVTSTTQNKDGTQYFIHISLAYGIFLQIAK